MAKIIAQALHGELDVILVHKIGAPRQPEYAIGSIGESGNLYFNPEVAVEDLPKSFLKAAAKRELVAIKKRRQVYSKGIASKDPRGRVVILIDDGIATGSTMLAAIREVRGKRPLKVVVGAAVAPPRTCQRLKAEADELVILESPSEFMAVGQFFLDFAPVTDEEIVQLLENQTSPSEGSYQHG
jgi:predicted phosphoribosyltransferase